VFPTTLLLLTLFRLGLTSLARLILLNGNTGTTACGHVIEAFGPSWWAATNIVGRWIFLVLIAIQYGSSPRRGAHLRSHGALHPGRHCPASRCPSTRTSTRASSTNRKPGRAPAIGREAEFYGAMDGRLAVHPARRGGQHPDHRINIIAGFRSACLAHGMDLRRAIETYTVLTIGDGLVTVLRP